MLKSNILFIINPISGGKKKFKLPEFIKEHLDQTKFNPSFSFTSYVGHAAKIAEAAVKKDISIIVAVGGDGTINEIAAKLINQNTVLGIIPFGSGNGLARSLNIPINIKKAIRLINQQQVSLIDTAKLNRGYFFNMAGMGFDAHISSVFANHKSRGLKGYVQTGLKEIISYQPQNYQIEIDGTIITRSAFMISIANSSQYGNNVHISPKSSLTDGLLDVCIVKPFPLYKLPILAYQMIRATTHLSNMVEIIRGKRIKISREAPGPIHLDGEPFVIDQIIDIEVLPLSLKVIAS